MKPTLTEVPQAPHGEQIELLEQKNKSLSDQLDKITSDLFKMQDIAADLKNKLDERKHSEQLAGWAIDRAIEVAKIKPSEHTDIIALAAKFCKWAVESSAPEAVPTTKE